MNIFIMLVKVDKIQPIQSLSPNDFEKKNSSIKNYQATKLEKKFFSISSFSG